MRPWIALFSQTGTEIYEIITRLNIVPDLVITNRRPEAKRTINPDLLATPGLKLVEVSNTPTDDEILNLFEDYDDPVITLHGWLRIIPPLVCDQYHIVNLHPGYIIKYPELKGKDPQLRAWDNKDEYEYCGVVLHQVTPKLDEGPAIGYSCHTINSFKDFNEFNRFLRESSLDLWKTYLKQQLYL